MVTTKCFRATCLFKAHVVKDFSSECYVCLLKYHLQESFEGYIWSMSLLKEFFVLIS